jgi:mycothiol synthase
VSRVDPGTFDWSGPAGAAAEVRRVVDVAAETDGRPALNEAALLELRHHGLANSALWVAGSPVEGFAWVHDQRGTPEPADLNLLVAPDSRGRGLGGLLGAAAVEGHTGALSAWSHGNHPAAAALADRLGFARVRDLWVMRRPLSHDLAALWDIDGVDVRPFEPGRDEAAFLTLNATAFAHHPEQGGLTRADLDQRMAEPWFDPAGFFLAVRGGELLGFHWTKVHDERPPFGEVYVVGVSPDAQGSGLGRLLTLTGLHHLRSLGLGEVILYVEADNDPAVALYRRLGFEHADADTDVMYRRPVTPGRP